MVKLKRASTESNDFGTCKLQKKQEMVWQQFQFFSARNALIMISRKSSREILPISDVWREIQ